MALTVQFIWFIWFIRHSIETSLWNIGRLPSNLSAGFSNVLFIVNSSTPLLLVEIVCWGSLSNRQTKSSLSCDILDADVSDICHLVFILICRSIRFHGSGPDSGNAVAAGCEATASRGAGRAEPWRSWKDPTKIQRIYNPTKPQVPFLHSPVAKCVHCSTGQEIEEVEVKHEVLLPVQCKRFCACHVSN